MNECARGTHNCDSNANCTNTEEGFICTCNPGYTGNGTIGTCMGTNKQIHIPYCGLEMMSKIHRAG